MGGWTTSDGHSLEFSRGIVKFTQMLAIVQFFMT
jgi:hypothetical protein